ncbi:hypothetical protein BB561_003263 [Smittium simulii]|uniref:UBC core domain-containing protein n=1 Tax=Smittium simulii TaxID=133385 RepID=A0A2T9YM85_9FUNG|nr:hypothetical protein BB561_003263 [Smittium simulii]
MTSSSSSAAKKKPTLSKIHIGNIIQPLDQDALKSPINLSSPRTRLTSKFLKCYPEDPDFFQKTPPTSFAFSNNLSLKSPLSLPPGEFEPDPLSTLHNFRKRNITSLALPKKQTLQQFDSTNDASANPSLSNLHFALSDTSKKSQISSYLQKYMIRLEMINLGDPEFCPSGVYTMTSFDSINVWYGCVFVHSGLWNNAVFKLKIIFPQEYPYESPKIYFLNKIFHPLVKESDGEFNLKPQFPTWKVYEDYLFLALAFLKDSFNNYLLSTLTLDDCFNTEAYSLYRNDLTKFAEIAQSNVRDSLTPSTLYRSESSDCPIVFSHLSDSEHESIKKKIHESVQKSSLHIKKQYRDL